MLQGESLSLSQGREKKGARGGHGERLATRGRRGRRWMCEGAMEEGERVERGWNGAGKKAVDVGKWRKGVGGDGQSRRWLGGRCVGYA